MKRTGSLNSICIILRLIIIDYYYSIQFLFVQPIHSYSIIPSSFPMAIKNEQKTFTARSFILLSSLNLQTNRRRPGQQQSLFPRRSTTFLYHSSMNNDQNNDVNKSDVSFNDQNNNNNNIRFLGKGSSSIIRPGVILLSPKNEYHHYYRNSAIFIFAMGEDTNNTNEYIIRGVILDMPTPFTLYEMMEQQAISPDNKLLYDNPLGNNFIFRGGDTGGEGVILLHNQKHNNIISTNTNNIIQEIGCTGIYQGGWDDAIQSCEIGITKPKDYKVFFNYCEFTEEQLESMLLNSDINDMWCSVEVMDNSIILNDEWDRSECWSKLRNAVSSYIN